MREIILNQGYVVKVDDVDYDFLMCFKWRILKDGHSWKGPVYARTSIKCADNIVRDILMHHLVLDRVYGYREDMEADHIDRDSLNNTRGNLRWVTHKENCMNRGSKKQSTSRYKGVSRYGNKWRAFIYNDGDIIYLGLFNNELEAAINYDLSLYKIHGDKGTYNFLPGATPALFEIKDNK